MATINSTSLKLDILRNIVVPGTNEEQVKAKAQDLGFKSSVDCQKAAQVFDSLYDDIIRNITSFMNSSEAQATYKDIHLFTARSSFTKEIEERLDKQIRATFGVDPKELPPEPQTLTSRMWTILGF